MAPGAKPWDENKKFFEINDDDLLQDISNSSVSAIDHENSGSIPLDGRSYNQFRQMGTGNFTVLA